jgi:hypothetical protein
MSLRAITVTESVRRWSFSDVAGFGDSGFVVSLFGEAIAAFGRFS